jgi:hydroxyquinol 1,2-dioxygenase
MVDSPARELGATIAGDTRGDPCLVTGRVTGTDGRPVPGAPVDVWQANADGFYDLQQPGLPPDQNLRGLFIVDDDGRFWFRTIVPRYDPIPETGRSGSSSGPLRGTRTARRTSTSRCPPGACGHDASVRRRHAVPRLRRCVRCEGQPGAGAPRGRDPSRAAEVGLPNPFRTVDFDVVLRRDDESVHARSDAEV